MLIKAGSGLAGSAEASSQGVTKQTSDNTLICELGDIEAIRKCFKDHPGEIAGIFLEPLPANNGLLPQSVSFLQELRTITTENDALLIFDEVISGFRIGFGGMAEKTGIKPDIITYGKIIGGGMPVGAIAGPKEIMENLAPLGDVYQAGTLSANPLAMEAGLATMKQLTPDFYHEIEKQTIKIKNLMNQWLEKENHLNHKVIHYGSLFWLSPSKETISNINQIPESIGEGFYTIFQKLLNLGIYLAPNAYEVGFVSKAHTDEVIEDLKNRLCL